MSYVQRTVLSATTKVTRQNNLIAKTFMLFGIQLFPRWIHVGSLFSVLHVFIFPPCNRVFTGVFLQPTRPSRCGFSESMSAARLSRDFLFLLNEISINESWYLGHKGFNSYIYMSWGLPALLGRICWASLKITKKNAIEAQYLSKPCSLM